MSAWAATVVAHLAAGAVAHLAWYFNFLPGPSPVQTVRVEVALPVVGNLIRCATSHLQPDHQDLLRRQFRALAKNVKNTLKMRDAYILELQELVKSNGPCPEQPFMKRFPIPEHNYPEEIDTQSHGYQEGWPVSIVPDYTRGVAAEKIRTAKLSAVRCGELKDEMVQVYDAMDTCQWEKEYNAAQYKVRMRRESNYGFHVKTNYEKAYVNAEVKLMHVAHSINPPSWRSEEGNKKWTKADAMAGSLGTGFRRPNLDPKSIGAGSVVKCKIEVQELVALLCSGRKIL